MVTQDIVNAVLIADGQVLLARRSAHRKAYANCWSFPGGHVQAGESRGNALVRELREELGVIPLASGKLGKIAEPEPETNGNVIYHFYAVTAWTGEPRLIGDEHSEMRWFDVDAACALSGLALPEYEAVLRKVG